MQTALPCAELTATPATALQLPHARLLALQPDTAKTAQDLAHARSSILELLLLVIAFRNKHPRARPRAHTADATWCALLPLELAGAHPCSWSPLRKRLAETITGEGASLTHANDLRPGPACDRLLKDLPPAWQRQIISHCG